MKKKKLQKGFSTLIVVIIIGGVLLSYAALVSVGSLTSVMESFSERKNKKAEFVLNACAEIALQKVKNDNTYTGSGSVYLDEKECHYEIFDGSDDKKLITANISVGNLEEEINISVDSLNPIIISSWEEKTN